MKSKKISKQRQICTIKALILEDIPKNECKEPKILNCERK